jgi:glycosyltransferase involved in cell wall biosynthesis
MEYQLEILLSTHNGERYLSDQIDSLLAQSYTDWRLLIRDDGSTDRTRNIIDDYINSYPDKIIFFQDELGFIGTLQSYSQLLRQSTAPYIAFCDQDDIWLSEKLDIEMSRMLEEEYKAGNDLPLLINTDLMVTTDTLDILSKSFWEYQNINPVKMSSLRNLLVQNHITGCTCLMNRALVNIALPISASAIMNDWWMALIASAKGKIISISTPTVLYRQHDKNAIGAKKWCTKYILREFLKGSSRYLDSYRRTRDQAKALLNSGLIDGNSCLTIKIYVDMFEKNWLERRMIMLKEGPYKYGFVRNLAMFIYL